MTILRVSALALNRHVGEPFVVSHSLPHGLLLSFFITCILQVYHPVTTTLKSADVHASNVHLHVMH